MALDAYHRKRDFRKTPEPKGGPAKRTGSELRFVVQKHAASHLHYDFRLELDGVLKSWAVPKGPSLDPAERRLAVHVEDHPVEYIDFEGVIPQGEYGGGTVMVWDTGTWAPEENPRRGYARGHLRFTLEGRRLKGSWTLARMGGRGDGRNWLLIKRQDARAEPGSGGAVVARHQRSVLSRRGMAGIAKAADRVWRSNAAPRGMAAAAPAPRITGRAPSSAADDPSHIPGARRRTLPSAPQPQLAVLAATAPEGDDWLHEIKFDGYRMLAWLASGKVALLSRNGKDWTRKFPRLAAALRALPALSALLDGEVVRLEANGISSFARLKEDLAAERTDDAVYFAFDLLHLDGCDLAAAPLESRKAALAALLGGAQGGPIRLSEHILGNGPAVYASACEHDLEGIVSKRRDAPYRAGRSSAWLKVKCEQREEFVILGWTDPQGQREGFGSLLLGYYDPGGVLRFAGGVGTGFTDRVLAALHARLTKLEQPASASAEAAAAAPRRSHWAKPTLVAQIRFTEWTRDGRLRHPAFLGLRDDKTAREVVHGFRNVPAGPRAVTVRRDVVEIGGVRISHADKLLYPDQGITKAALAEYYAAVAEHMLPHIAERPLTLVRCPEGRHGHCFFQKHVGAGVPAALHRVAVPEKDGMATYLTADDLPGLIALVQMGALEIHVWGSTRRALERPDRLIFDLDPDEGLPWRRVVDAALATRALLEELGLKSFAKATGGKGLHLVVPLRPTRDWPDIKRFSRAVADELVRRDPAAFTASLAKATRRGRIFVDYLRNQRGATAIAPYSVRARAGATVAAPLAWDEVERGVRGDRFTVATLPQRLASLREDPWRDMAQTRQSVSAAAMRRLRIAD